MTAFLVLSTIMFLFLTFIWSKVSWNFLIKITFFCMFIYGLVLTLSDFGFVIRG